MTVGADKKAVDADLVAVRFRAGELRRQWRRISYDFPLLIVAVAAVEPDGSKAEYYFRFELTSFPTVAPEVMIWDAEKNAKLAPGRRPKGSSRVVEAFKEWGDGSVYRPWDRHGAVHNNWGQTFRDLAWDPSRDLAFILEDIHGLLSSNALAVGQG